MNQKQNRREKTTGGAKIAALDFKADIDFTAVDAQGHTLRLNVTDSVQWQSIGNDKFLMPHPNHVLAWLVGSSECLRKGMRVVMPILRDDGEVVFQPVVVTNTVMNQFNIWASWWRSMCEEQDQILDSVNKEETDDKEGTS